MNDRRRFLHVLGATTAAVALPACGGTETTATTGTTGAGGAGGSGSTTGSVGGAGGTGATTGDTSSATASSSTGGGCEMTPVGVAVGVPDDFTKPGLHIVPGTKVLIGRDDKGLYALTSICPHEFCDMDATQNVGGMKMPVGTVTAQGIVCNCHNSKFDNYGAVMKGPANKPLKPFAMALGCDGKLYVDKTTVVSINQRLDA